MKRCYVCGKDLLEILFSKNRSKPDGLTDACKCCKKELDKKYRQKYKLAIKVRRHGYYLSNKDEIVRKVNAYIKVNRSKHNAWGTTSKNKLKAEVLSNYCCAGLKCNNCEVSDLGILTIDHVNGNGADHRREIFGNNRTCGYNFYRWLKRNSYPSGFQVLCYNCQFRKRNLELKPENPTHLQQVRAKYARSIKVECLDSYGGCECSCGEKDLEVLTLDHVNDDGAEHRRETNTRGNNFYHMLRKNGFPKEPPLQVMCLNCQIHKRNKKYVQKSTRRPQEVS